MSESKISLEQISINKPCPKSWDEMKGDDRVRYCSHCCLNVYNLSGMSRKEGEKLINEQEGRLCVRMYRRDDGLVVTSDCERIRFQRTAKVVRHVAAGLAVLLTIGAGGGLWAAKDKSSQPRVGQHAIIEWLFPAKLAPPPPLMGDICITPAPPTPVPPPQPTPTIQPDSSLPTEVR